MKRLCLYILVALLCMSNMETYAQTHSLDDVNKVTSYDLLHHVFGCMRNLENGEVNCEKIKEELHNEFSPLTLDITENEDGQYIFWTKDDSKRNYNVSYLNKQIDLASYYYSDTYKTWDYTFYDLKKTHSFSEMKDVCMTYKSEFEKLGFTIYEILGQVQTLKLLGTNGSTRLEITCRSGSNLQGKNAWETIIFFSKSTKNNRYSEIGIVTDNK